MQIFVISNGTYTKYYSNTTRNSHVKEISEARGKSKKTSNSFEFTSYWSDGSNKVISDLVDFTKTFFAKHTILNILTRYCVFTAENLLLVMRPYQIAATERILTADQPSFWISSRLVARIFSFDVTTVFIEPPQYEHCSL